MHDIAGGTDVAAAIVKTEKNPESKKPDDLGADQLRWFSTLRKVKADHEAEKKHREDFTSGDPTRAPLPFYLGDDIAIAGTSLSPSGRYLLVVTRPKGYDEGRKGKLQRFVTDSGYEEQEDERTRVGRNDPAPQSLLLLDLARHAQHALAVDGLPGIHDDPLKAVREENAKLKRERGIAAGAEAQPTASAGDGNAKEKKKNKDPDAAKTRALRIVAGGEDGGGGGIAWSSDGQSLAIQMRAIDNKDRWIVTVDLDRATLATQHRLTDPAWINWNFNEFGWARDNRTLWYVSEESGYAQLYTKVPGGKAHALTRGRFEVSHPAQSADGKWFYLRANVEAPYLYDVYRVPFAGGALERVTTFKGMEQFTLSPDGSQLAVLHSSAYVPPQLAVVASGGGARARAHRHANARIQGDDLDRAADRRSALDARRSSRSTRSSTRRATSTRRRNIRPCCSCTAPATRRTCTANGRTISASRCSTTCLPSTVTSCSTWTIAQARATGATGAPRSTATWAIPNSRT